jgi:predicted nucleic acid-binding protein
VIPLAVFDCMVFVQALASDQRPAFACLQLVREGKVELCVSPGILAEISDVLVRP